MFCKDFRKWKLAVITECYFNWPGQQSWSMARGLKSYLQQPVIASPVIQQKQIGELQTAVSPLLGLVGVAYWWIMLDDEMLLHPPQVKHLWFQMKQIEAISQSMTVCVVWCGIDIQWLLPLTCMTLYTYVSACSRNIIYNERHARWRTTHGKEIGAREWKYGSQLDQNMHVSSRCMAGQPFSSWAIWSLSASINPFPCALTGASFETL